MRQRKRLTAVLIARNLRDNLRRDIAGGKEAVRLFNHGFTDDRAVLQHILQIDEVTVVFLLRKIVGIMEMNDALFMCLDNILRQQDTHGQVLAHLTRHIVALGRVDNRIFVGIFLLDVLIEMINQSQNFIICRVRFTSEFPLIPIAHILLCHLIAAHLHDADFYHILHIFDMCDMRQRFQLLFYGICYRLNLVLIQSMNRLNLKIGSLYGIDDLR